MSKNNALSWLWIMVAAAVLTQTAINLLRPVTSYKLLALGAGEGSVGLATAAYAILPLALAMWLGRLSGRLPTARGVIILGIITLSLGGMGLAWGSSVILLIISSAVLGLGQLIFTIAGQTAISRWSPTNKMDVNFGWFTAAFSIGQMVGPLLSGLILGNTTLGEAGMSSNLKEDIDSALWLAAGTCLLAVPVMYMLGRGDRQLNKGSKNNESALQIPKTQKIDPESADLEKKPTILRIVRLPGLPSQILASLAMVTMLDILTTFMPLVGEAAGVSPWWVGVLLAARGGASFLSRIVLPWLSKTWPRNQLVIVSMMVSTLTLALVPVVLNLWQAMWLALLFIAIGGFLLGIGPPLMMSMLSQSVPSAWRGPALALRLMGNRAGQVVLPVVAGLVASPLGPAAGIWCACTVLALSGVERIFSTHRRP